MPGGFSIPGAPSVGGGGAFGFPFALTAVGTAPFVSATIMGAVADIASGNVAPAVTTGQSIPIDGDGWIVLVQFDSVRTIADATKMTVNITRPGNTGVVGSAATTRTDTALGVKQIRRVYPNNAAVLLPGAGNAFYITVDNLIHASDTITSIVFAAGFFTGQSVPITIGSGAVTNTSAQIYAKPIVRPVFKPWQRMDASNNLTVEFAAIHEWAAFGSQVARVEARCKVGATYGAWSGTTTMARSAQAPATGRNPARDDAGFGGAPCFDSYTFTVSGAGLADGAGFVAYRAYGWYGDVIWDSETDGDAFGTTQGAPALWPFVKDAAGLHTPFYAYVNRDGTGLLGTSVAGVSTGTTDPGAAASYTTYAEACKAARLWNNNIANRSTVHNDTSGLVILLRDVAGGTIGNSTFAYWQRATLSGYSDGLMPPVMASASYLTSGTTTALCRLRGVQDDGVTAATSKVLNGKWELRGLTLDGIGTTGAAHTVFDGAAAAGCFLTSVDCDQRDLTTVATSVLIYRWGTQYHFRVAEGSLVAGEGASNVGAFSNICLSVASSYSSGTVSNTRTINATAFCATWLRQVLVLNTTENGILYSVRGDYDTLGAAPAFLGQTPILKGLGVCNLMLRGTNMASQPMMKIAADGTLYRINNLVIQNMINWGQRSNIFYQDQGWIQITKRGSMRSCLIWSVNNKSDYFPAPEVPSGNVWAASTVYNQGQIVSDNNATVAARIYYQALVDQTSGTVLATDLANTALWQPGTVAATAFGSQPRRTGNWRFRNMVRNWGNIFSTSSSDTGLKADGTSWFGEAIGRNSLIYDQAGGTDAGYKRVSTTIADYGDYRPKSTAAGDSINATSLGRVVANYNVTPNDILGVAFRTDGTGAAGCYERTA